MLSCELVRSLFLRLRGVWVRAMHSARRSVERGLFSVSYKTWITFRKQSCGRLDLTHIINIAQKAP